MIVNVGFGEKMRFEKDSMQKIVFLTGAGISAESGISTFRDAGGLWEGHDIMEVASPEGWRKNPALVLDFYNKRRAQLKEVEPNVAHKSMAELEKYYQVSVVTQNVDDLHERAGSSQVLHLHGELRKARSLGNEKTILPWLDNLNIGDVCAQGHQLRPHIVWFGEAVPLMDQAIYQVMKADILVVVGTSMQVYPAAGLVQYASAKTSVYYIDPKPHINYELAARENLVVIPEIASIGTKILIQKHLLKG